MWFSTHSKVVIVGWSTNQWRRLEESTSAIAAAAAAAAMERVGGSVGKQLQRLERRMGIGVVWRSVSKCICFSI